MPYADFTVAFVWISKFLESVGERAVAEFSSFDPSRDIVLTRRLRKGSCFRCRWFLRVAHRIREGRRCGPRSIPCWFEDAFARLRWRAERR